MVPRNARVALALAVGLAVITAGRAASPAGHLTVGPNASAGYTGVTSLGSNTGCSCHGGAANANTTVQMTGPTTLYPGERGTYTIQATKTIANGTGVGIDVAAADAGSLSSFPNEPTQVINNEVTHTSSRRTISNNTASYQFYYTMPPAAVIGTSTHTLAAVAAVGYTGTWNSASNIAVTTVAPPDPASITTGTINSTSINLTWAGTSPEFRVIRKPGSSQTFTGPTDGASTLVYEGPNTAATATGLTASTAYTFAVYGKVSGASTYSTGNRTVSATTSAGGAGTLYFVNVGTGNDLNSGLSSGAAFKTIKKALTVALNGDTINVAPGTYNATSGETFPISIPSGVKLLGSGAATTIIDASDANPRDRVFTLSGGSASTQLSNFTITGGFVQSQTAGSISIGGGLHISGGDQTTISNNIVTGNEARGYTGFDPNSPSGGQAYGGGIYIASAAPVIVNNVIRNNAARGGNGVTHNGSTVPGGQAGNGQGGGISCNGDSSTIINNTIVANSAIGGNGGASLGAGGNGGNGDGGAASFCVVVNGIVANNSASSGTGGNGSPQGSSGSGSTAGGLSNGSATNCLFFGNNPTTNQSTGTNAVLADPLFVDANNNNYRVQPSSPAKATGTAAGAPATDFDGNTRPNPPTIGAFEAVKASTTTALQSSLNPSSQFYLVTFTATVTSGVTGPITGSVAFFDGATSLGSITVSNGTASFSTNSLSQGSHSITATYSGDSNYATSTSAILTQTVNVPPFGPPPGLVATATSTSQVALSWIPVSGATSYDIFRNTGAGYLFLTTISGASYNDTGLSANTTYVYRVRTNGSSGTSALGVPDAATTIIFTDDPLNAGTIVKAAHITELRTAVNAMRTAAALTPATFTDASLGGVKVKAIHLTELRTALDQARQALVLLLIPYVDPMITVGVTTIKRQHILELRNGVK